MEKTELTSPLPDGPGIEIIRDIMSRYPNRYLVFDFWGYGCGACLVAIQNSKQLRAEIAKRDDVKIIFIADEKTAGGSDAYKKYVAEWLADEETICLTNADFSRLRELFHFNAIPHYETITPDCLFLTTKPLPPTAAVSATTCASTDMTTSITNFKG